MPLGAGELDLTRVVQALRENGYDGWLVAELDDYAGAPREAAEISKRFLDGVVD
jgi:inosose dehydratase